MATSSDPDAPALLTPPSSARRWGLVVAGTAAALVVIGAALGTTLKTPQPDQQVQHASPPRAVTQAEANAKAARIAKLHVVDGDRFVWLGIGDWGRCG